MEEKKRLRAALKQKRASLDAEQKKKWNSAIVKQIAASEVFRRASAVLLYAPIAGEIDLLPLVRIARNMGKPVAFPRCDTETNTMKFYRLEPEAHLIRGAYGIPEPPAEAPLCALDADTLCILPALTFSPSGARIGYGKGYYDRFLAAFPGVAVGAVYQALLVKNVPVEAHDRPVTLIFTERGTLKPQRERAAEAGKNADVDAKKEEKTAPLQGKRGLARLLQGLFFACATEQNATAVAEIGASVGRGIPGSPLHKPPILVAATFVLLILSRLIDTGLTDRNQAYVVVILLQLMIFLIPAVVYAMLRGDDFAKQIRMQAPRLKHAWFFVCVLVMMISGGLLCGILTGGISSLTGSFTLYDTFVARSNGSVAETVYLILAYGILPAFCEELIFRAFLCAEYEKFGVGVAVTVSALFFAMLHFSFPLFLSYLFLGALLAGAMYATRSFFVPLLLHLCYNLFCLFGQPYLSAFYVNAGSNEIFIFCLVVLFLLFAAFATGEARKIYHVYARENADSSYAALTSVRQLPRALLRAVLSPACAVCLLIWLVMAIVNLL